LLLLFVLSGVVLGQTEKRNFFNRGRAVAHPSVGGQQFQGNVLRVGGHTNFRKAVETVEQDIVAEETASAFAHARQDLDNAQVAPASDARVRPEIELEHSIQGQVAEALIRGSLTGRTQTGPPTRPEGHSPDGIRSRLIQRPVQRPIATPEPRVSTISATERQEISRFRASRPSRLRPLAPTRGSANRQEEIEPIARQAPIQPRRIVAPPSREINIPTPQSRRTVIRRPDPPALKVPASIRPAVQIEVDAMMKKHSAALRVQAGSDKMEEIKRNLLVAKLNTHMAKKEAALEKAEASSENSSLAAEIEELRARLLKAEEALVGRSKAPVQKLRAPVDANNNLPGRAREFSQFRSRQPESPRSFNGESRQPEEIRQPEVAPKDDTPVYQPGSFFGRNSQIPAVPLRQKLPVLQRQPIQMVKVKDIQVPKFSKMVKNIGLRILPSDERSIPVEEIVFPSRSNPRTSDVRQRQQKLAPRKNIQQTPEPAVQGFKVVGDRSNRVIFLNVAELGLTLGPGRTLKLGNSELVPVDSTSADPIGPPQFGDRFMNIDAVDKMITTHSQHNALEHRPVNLPAFRNPLDVRTSPQQVRGRLQPAGNRFESAREAQTKPQARKQPIFFTNKFDEQKPVAVEEPSRQTPRQGKALQETSRSQIGKSVQFGSFPQRSGLPQQNARSQQPVRSQQSARSQQPVRSQQPARSQQPSQQLSRVQQLPVQQEVFRAQQIPDQLSRFQIPQQQTKQLEPVPLSRQFSRFQQQSQIQRQLPQRQQQARFQETPRFETVRERLEAQIPRYEAPQQTNLPPPDVPGIEAHLAEQNKIINLQRTQSEKAATLERRRLGLEQPPQQNTRPQQNFQQQQPQQNFQQLQQSYQQQAIQNQQPQQQNLIPQVPGLQEHQAALQQHLATIQQFNAQRPEHQSQPQQQQPVPQFQPQPIPQYQPQPQPTQFQQQSIPQFQPQPQPTQFSQPTSQHQTGLQQHARFVSELQAAQQALGGR